MDSCCKNYGKKKNLFEYIWHNRICGSSEGVYLHIYSGEITFSLLDNFINTKTSIYLNKFGESLKSKSISEDFVLHEEILKNLLNEFRNLSYCKYFKINQQNILNTGQEDIEDI